MSFAQNLSAERTKNQLSEAAFAKTCGISLADLNQLEAGATLPPAKMMPKIARALNVKNNVVLNWYLEDMRSSAERA